MSRSLIGVVSFGNLQFLKVFLQSVKETLTTPNTDVIVVVAKPGDEEMCAFLNSEGYKFITNERNVGFPASCNDLYDAAFVHGDYDNLIFCGNDVVVMPGAIDAMIAAADSTNWEMICGSEYNARFMWNNYPECRKYFTDEATLGVTQEGLNARFWELHRDFKNGLEPDTLKDVRNFTLFKRSAFEKVGYDDVNFWPNGYFCDNCVARRCHATGVTAAGLKEAAFFHFWSRTINEGEPRNHSGYFERNRMYYTHKWHGVPNQEKLDTPFGGGPYFVGNTQIPTGMKIESRDHEAACIEYWSKL